MPPAVCEPAVTTSRKSPDWSAAGESARSLVHSSSDAGGVPSDRDSARITGSAPSSVSTTSAAPASSDPWASSVRSRSRSVSVTASGRANRWLGGML